MQIRDRIKEFKRIPSSNIRPNPKNWRTHPKQQQDALRGVLAEIGIADAVLVREIEPDVYMLVDGHLRCETVGQDTNVPALVLDVSELEADKILATLDPLAELAEKDTDALAGLLSDLSKQQDNLASLVWPDYIVDPLLADNWEPPGQPAGDDSGDGGEKETKAPPVVLTGEEREALHTAVAECRKYHEDESLTEGQCIVLICQHYCDTRTG